MTLRLHSADQPCLVLRKDWAIELDDEIREVGFFEPLFGAYRKTVNPAEAQVSGRTIFFSAAGEYYLVINGDQFAKVLILPPADDISSSVLKIFDFCIANICTIDRHESRYAADPLGTVAGWFRSREPLFFLCSSAHELFRTIVKEVFSLPTRRVLLPGTGRMGGKVYKVIHHVLEVFLPDVCKWVVFDLTNGFLVRWFDAFDMVDFVRENEEITSLGTGFVKTSALTSLEIHNGGVVTFLPKTFNVTGDDANWKTDVSRLPIPFYWINMFKFYYGGVAYFFEFEDHNCWERCLFASRHEDEELQAAALEWIKENGFTPVVVTQEELRARLNEAFYERIAKADWLGM